MFNKQIASDLWRQGLSQSAIAAHFGMTKGQIAGKFARDRATFPKRKETIERLEREIKGVLFDPVSERKTANVIRKLFHAVSNAPKPISKAEAEEYDKSRLPYAVTMANLENNCCRWSVTEHPRGTDNLFCNEVRAGKNYCDTHQQRAWRQA